MDIDGMNDWLGAHFGQIHRFMDYTPFIVSNAEVHRTLSSWFNNPDWAEDGEDYRFASLGKSFRGCQFLAWFRHKSEPPQVVYMGSEGGRGVLTGGLEDWAKLIAHAPRFREHPIPTQVVVDEAIGAGGLEGEEAKSALLLYRAAVEVRFGVLPQWESLLEGVGVLNEEFCLWVESKIVAYVHVYSMKDLMTHRLTAAPRAGVLRQAVGERLGFERVNARKFLELLNGQQVPWERFMAAVREARRALG